MKSSRKKIRFLSGCIRVALAFGVACVASGHAFGAVPDMPPVFGAFNLSMDWGDSLSPASQLQLLQEQGYRAIAITTIELKKAVGQTQAHNLEDAAGRIREYTETPQVKSGSIKLLASLLMMSLDEPLARDSLDGVTSELGKSHAYLWTMFTGQTTPANAAKRIGEVADIARAHGVEVVLYPHAGTPLETAEQAVDWMRAAGRDNVRISLHLCHELMAGNGARLGEIIRNVAPYVKLVTLNGADRNTKKNGSDYSRTILALGSGDLDVRHEFYEPLRQAGYNGPFILHTFGLKDPSQHLANALTVWKQWQTRRAFDAPESVIWHEKSRSWYVSNLGGGVSLAKDGYGWITRLDENGQVAVPQWVDGLDAPTGMATVGDTLYVGDRGVVVAIDIPTAKIVRRIEIPNSEFVNDVAAGPDGTLYVSDFFKNQIYRINHQLEVETFVASDELDTPNGLWVDRGKLYVGTWGPIIEKATFATSRLGTIKFVDLRTRKISAVGHGAPIGNFDGITRYRDGTFATDWSGGRLLYISDEGAVSELLSGFKQFADFGFDPARRMFVLPEMSKDRVIVLRGQKLLETLH